MFKVIMNGTMEVGTKFEDKKKAQEYVKSAKAVDKRCGQKVAYKIEKC